MPPGPARQEVIAEIDRSFDELDGLLRSLVVLSELTARTSDFVLARGERLSARLMAAALDAAGTRARYVDAVDVVITDGPFGGASPNLMLTDLTARKILRPLLAAGIVPVVPGFLGATPGRRQRRRAAKARAIATLGRGGSDLTATLLGRALGAARDQSVEGRARPADRRPARRARRARDPAAARARGVRAGLLRRQGAAPARADPDRRASDPGLRAAVRRSVGAGHRDLRRGARWIAIRSRRCRRPAARRCSRSPATACSACPASRRAPSRRCTRQGTSVSLISQSSSEQSICFSVPEASAKRARERLPRSFARRSAATRSTASRSWAGWPRWRSSASAWRGTPASRRACSARCRRPASTSSPSRRARRS